MSFRVMKKKIVLVLTLCAMLLSACGDTEVDDISPGGADNMSSSESSYDPFQVHETQKVQTANTMYSSGFGVPLSDGKIKYEKDMSVDFYIQNAGDDSNFGFALYVDGIRQTFSVDDEAEVSDFHVFEIESGVRKNFTVHFEPVAETYSDTLDFAYAITNNPDFTPDSPTVVFGNNYKTSASNVLMTDVPEDVKLAESSVDVEPTEISNEEKQDFIDYDENGNVTGNKLEKETQIRILKNGLPSQDDDPTPNCVNSSDKLEIQVLGGEKQLWRVSMCVDHKIVPAFGGSYYADMTADSATKSSYTVDMSEIELPKQDYGAIYFVAFPIGQEHGKMKMSPVMVYDSGENGDA